MSGNYVGNQPNAVALNPFIPRNWIDGLTLSTPGASASFTVQAGEAQDVGRTTLMQLAAAITKTTAAFVEGNGNGALDQGIIAANTWYHVFEILRPGPNVDILFSLSPTAPTMPAAYAQRRRIGSMRTTAASLWTRFFQDNDYFVWDVPGPDWAQNAPGLAAVLRTMLTPLGVRVRGNFQASINAAAALQRNLYVTDPQQADTAPTGATGGVGSMDGGMSAAGTVWDSQSMDVWTNLLSQVRTRVTSSDGNVTYGLSTHGWLDPRGKDAP